MMASVARLLRPRRQVDLSHVHVTVYTRAQCTCCHKALDLLQEAQRRYRFPIETVDIDTDPLLVEQFNELVPVVTVNGKIRFKGVVNPVLLERLLLAEARQA